MEHAMVIVSPLRRSVAQSPTPRPHVTTSESQRERSGVPTGGDALEIASGHTKMGCQPGDCR